MLIITDSQELKKRIAGLADDEFVAIDTEFLREKTYYPQLCLVQIAGENDNFAIDTLSDGLDMTPFWSLLANEKIIKVFHACQQDIEIFIHAGQAVPKPLVDTQVAAQILGIGDYIGYGNLVEKLCNVTLDKSSRHTDWSKRPLSSKQIDYAMSDVTYLRTVYKTIVEELAQKNRTSWLSEEMEKFFDTKLYVTPEDEMWTKLKLRSGSAKYLSAVKQLATWREKYAKRVNKPRTWIMKNDAIFEIASIMPQKIDDLANLRFYSSKKNTAIGNEIISVLERSKDLPPPAIAKHKRLPDSIIPMIDLLKVLLKAKCNEYGVSPGVVGTARDIEEIAVVVDLAENQPGIEAMQGWRFEVFGRFAIDLKQGKISLSAQDGKISLINTNNI